MGIAVEWVISLDWRDSVLNDSFRLVLQHLNGHTPEGEERYYEDDALDDLDEMTRQVAEDWLNKYPSDSLARDVLEDGLLAPLIVHAAFTLNLYEREK